MEPIKYLIQRYDIWSLFERRRHRAIPVKQTETLKTIVADFCKHQDYGKAWKQLAAVGAGLLGFAHAKGPLLRKIVKNK